MLPNGKCRRKNVRIRSYQKWVDSQLLSIDIGGKCSMNIQVRTKKASLRHSWREECTRGTTDVLVGMSVYFKIHPI